MAIDLSISFENTLRNRYDVTRRILALSSSLKGGREITPNLASTKEGYILPKAPVYQADGFLQNKISLFQNTLFDFKA